MGSLTNFVLFFVVFGVFSLITLLYRRAPTICSTWNKVFQKIYAFETLCFWPRNKVFLPQKQSVSSTEIF